MSCSFVTIKDPNKYLYMINILTFTKLLECYTSEHLTDLGLLLRRSQMKQDSVASSLGERTQFSPTALKLELPPQDLKRVQAPAAQKHSSHAASCSESFSCLQVNASKPI
ncbi:chaperone DnaJ-domain superfamily protein [Striga asiatica]|uniref:Chaperone DnaJ-domain superfamily protein n=1 Tax=Striga asiatica TaxID=4170 RepID=A0A5A7RD40_STRAF|nr:chaperone DnaJ-domain superfamily protein [Striga asiatica]